MDITEEERDVLTILAKAFKAVRPELTQVGVSEILVSQSIFDVYIGMLKRNGKSAQTYRGIGLVADANQSSVTIRAIGTSLTANYI